MDTKNRICWAVASSLFTQSQIQVILSSYFFSMFFSMFKKNVVGAMHFIYSHKYDTNSAEDSSDMNWIVFTA